jgi:hypothetical protein
VSGDGAVTRTDVALVAMNFGRQAGAPSPSPAAALVTTTLVNAAERDGLLSRRAGAVRAVRRPIRPVLPATEVDDAMASGLHAPTIRRDTITDVRGARRLRIAT